MDIDSYLDTLASSDPVPGGGSAATLVGALGAALCAMVARITAKAPKHRAVWDEADAIATAADDVRAALVELRPADEAAFAAVVAAQGLPRGNDAERRVRTERLQHALTNAAGVPLRVAGKAVDVMALAERTAALRNPHLNSDVTCAAQFARAAFEASAANVRINHVYLHDAALAGDQAGQLAALTSRIAAHADAIHVMLGEAA